MMYILGQGGHAKVLNDMVGCSEYTKQICKDEEHLIEPKDDLVMGIGDINTRWEAFERYPPDQFFTVVHPQAFVSLRARLARGVAVMAMAVVNAGAQIEDNVLINTGAQVDHDCIVGPHTVIAPGAVLCGRVELGVACKIGAGAIILEGVKLPDGTGVPAATLVVSEDDWRMSPPRGSLKPFIGGLTSNEKETEK